MFRAHQCGMTLNDYLALGIDTETTLARRAGIAQPTVNRLRRHESWPSRSTIKKLIEASGGKLSLHDLLPPEMV
jgi:predicted transcriptional regulator